VIVVTTLAPRCKNVDPVMTGCKGFSFASFPFIDFYRRSLGPTHQLFGPAMSLKFKFREMWSSNNLTILCAAIFLVGAAFRLSQYIANRSLWDDEAMLALNIVNRSVGGLLQPLDDNQGAPLGFLLVEKLLTVLFGNTDYVLRVFPLICGVASIWGMYALAKRIFVEPVAIIAAVVLFTFADRLIYYASEVKQYSSDVLLCLLLLYAIARTLERNRCTRDFVRLAAAGTVAIGFSHPALFILAGGGCTLGIEFIFNRDWRNTIKLGCVAVVWSVSFLALYFISLRHLSANRALFEYWSYAFMPLPPWRNWGWFIETPRTIVGLGLPPQITVALLAVGTISISVRRWQYGLMLLLPILFTLIASALHKYPFSDRLVLFLKPIMLLLIAESIGRTQSVFDDLKRFPRMGFPLALGILAWVAANQAYSAARHLRYARVNEEIKPMLSYLSHQGETNDILYVYGGSKPAFQYYLPFYRLGKFRVEWGSSDKQHALSELNQLRGSGRVWVLFSHFDKSFFLENFHTIGKPIDQITTEGAWLGFYDL
jgi:hypothetical protein